MKMSRRARRMATHHRRHKRTTTLNMVSLMDIFTILVFFLLVNASEVELITPPKGVELPESWSEQKPEQQLTLSISRDSLLLNNQTLTQDITALGDGEGSYAPIVAALEKLDAEPDSQLSILADRSIEYRVIKRVLQSCTEAGYDNTALAVLQVTEPTQ